MKSLLTMWLVGLAACCAGLVSAATSDEAHEQEMKKCAVCKYIAEKPELMKNSTWETHKINEGMLCVVSVPKEMKKDFDAVHKKMMEAIAKVKVDQQAGRPVELCGFCMAMGEFARLGAKQQDVDTTTGSIWLVTSTDPTVVEKIHAHADKVKSEHEHVETAAK